jgi:hypothetical protein
VVAVALDLGAPDGRELPHRVRQFEFAAGAALGFVQAVEDLGREDVAADDRQVRRGGLAGRFLDEVVDGVAPAARVRDIGDAVGGDLLPGDAFERDNRLLVVLGDVDEVLDAGGRTLDEVVAQEERERFVADVVLGVLDGRAQTRPVLLADVVDVREVGDLPNSL